MAEQWIPAYKAFEIIGSELRLTNMLRSGLLKAKAGAIRSTSDEYARNQIRADFWQTDRYHEFKADWRSGYCSNVFEDTVEVYISGLTIELSGLLEAVPADERGLLARSLSVAGVPDWIPALQARRLCFSVVNPTHAASWLMEQARLGFVVARAVKAEMKRAGYDDHCVWAEREWDVPVWFWENFTKGTGSRQSWETGQFSGRGRSPHGNGELVLSGLYFHAPTLRQMAGLNEQALEEKPHVVEDTGRKGRRHGYDWFAATSTIWGRLFRNEFLPLPENQADIEKALIDLLRVGDKEPGESTVRPYAKYIFDEFEKP
ncbi:MAG: hypothetical protein ACOVQ0_02840 [Novosphingobium sp.]|uniref:hypothetical protein n=1 Tax=Novosphingobium sp. TaxID=1874826 RepID=UPI003B9BFCB0